jgi:hypothetical protein
MYKNNIFFLKKLFLILVRQNDIKIQKNINLKQKNNFFKKYF